MSGCVDANYYSIDHPRTKEAENFIKEMSYRRKEGQRYQDLRKSAFKEKIEHQKEREAEMKEM